jgi:hypothetical protein
VGPARLVAEQDPARPEQGLEGRDAGQEVESRDDPVVGIADRHRTTGFVGRGVDEGQHPPGESREVLRHGLPQPLEEPHPHDQVLEGVVMVVDRLLSIDAVREVLAAHLVHEEGSGVVGMRARAVGVREEDPRGEESDELPEEVVVGRRVGRQGAADVVGLLGDGSENEGPSLGEDGGIRPDLEREAPRDEPQAQLERTAPVDPPVAGFGLDPVENDRGDRRGGALVARPRPLECPGCEELVTVQLPGVLAVAHLALVPVVDVGVETQRGADAPSVVLRPVRPFRGKGDLQVEEPDRMPGAGGEEASGLGEERRGLREAAGPQSPGLTAQGGPQPVPKLRGRHGGQAVTVPAQAPHAGPRTLLRIAGRAASATSPGHGFRDRVACRASARRTGGAPPTSSAMSAAIAADAADGRR